MSSRRLRVAWKDRNLVDKLLVRLNNATEPSENGSISFTAFDHSELFDLLTDFVVTPSGLTENDMAAISYRAFLDLRRTGCVASKELLAEIGRKANELINLPQVKFTMWTKFRLSGLPFSPGTRFKIDGVSMRTVANLPGWLRLEEHFISGVGRIDPSKPAFFGYQIFTVLARNENEAANQIFKAKEKFQAIVNTVWRTTESYIQRRATAVLLDGPYYFFFEKKRFLGTDKVWYSQEYDHREFELFPKNAREFVGHADKFRKVLKRLETHPLRMPIERSLLLIGEGMKSNNLSFRLVRFWSAAEALYSSQHERTSRDTMIARMTFVEGEERLPIERRKLERSYELRSEYVHHGSTEKDDSSLTQNLREVVLRFVYYLLFNAEDIETHDDLFLMIDPRYSPAKSDRVLRAIERRRLIVETGRHRER